MFKSAILIFPSLLCLGSSEKLPSTLRVCHRNDPNINECLLKAIEHALPYLKQGWPELGVPSAQPIEYDSVTIEMSSSDNLHLTQKLSNVKIYNVIDSVVNKTEFIKGDNEIGMVVHLFIKYLKMDTNYDLQGQFLLLPVTGNGDATLDMYGINSVVALKAVIYDKKGEAYLKVTELTTKLTPSSIKYNFRNLFNGNKQLGDEMNKLLDEHWKDVLEDVRGPFEDVVADFCKSVFQAVFDRVPYDELFPL